jgi:hypothetical protein
MRALISRSALSRGSAASPALLRLALKSSADGLSPAAVAGPPRKEFPMIEQQGAGVEAMKTARTHSRKRGLRNYLPVVATTDGRVD